MCSIPDFQEENQSLSYVFMGICIAQVEFPTVTIWECGLS